MKGVCQKVVSHFSLLLVFLSISLCLLLMWDGTWPKTLLSFIGFTFRLTTAACYLLPNSLRWTLSVELNLIIF